MKVIITGGRQEISPVFVATMLENYHKKNKIEAIIHDDNSNLSKIVSQWATDNDVSQIRVKPNYDKLGKLANIDVASRMFELYPDKLLVFPGLSPRSHMIAFAGEYNVDVVNIKMGVVR